MTRRLLFLSTVAFLVALPLGAWAQTTLVKTADGTEFKFGIAEKLVGFSTAELDFHERFNFRSLTVPDVAFGDNTSGIFNFTNLLFTMEKGPLSIHANLEVEALMDERVADVNHLNLERANITYKLPTLGALTLGFDVHLFDPEGGLIYQDEDPGIWLIGSNGPWSWNLGYHKRFEGSGLGQLGRFLINPAISDPVFPGTGKDVDTDIFEARVGYDVKLPNGHLTVSPLLLAVVRRSPGANFGGALASCPTVDFSCGPEFTGRSGDDTNLYYPGVVVAGKVGPFMPTLEVAGMFGSVDGITDGLFVGPRDMDARSFALFAELAFDLSKAPSPMLAGLTPFISVEWHRGDDDPFDNDLEGFVSQSNLSSALRKDGFNKQSISSFGPPPLGAGGQAAWGFDVAGRGIGPTLGNIVEGGLNSAVFFNERFGKGDNPGFMKISAGAVGKLAPQWDTHFAISYYRYDQTDPIRAEAAINQLELAALGGAGPCAEALPTTLANVRACANSLSVSKNMGVEINANVGYTINNFRIQPFFSVFIPGDAATDINQLFTGIADNATAYIAGVEFSARF